MYLPSRGSEGGRVRHGKAGKIHGCGKDNISGSAGLKKNVLLLPKRTVSFSGGVSSKAPSRFFLTQKESTQRSTITRVVSSWETQISLGEKGEDFSAARTEVVCGGKSLSGVGSWRDYATPTLARMVGDIPQWFFPLIVERGRTPPLPGTGLFLESFLLFPEKGKNVFTSAAKNTHQGDIPTPEGKKVPKRRGISLRGGRGK